jgi:hypothetical protein
MGRSESGTSRRSAKPRAKGSPRWVDDEERRAKSAALRGRPQPASADYQRFIEDKQGQQRLPLGDDGTSFAAEAARTEAQGA